MNKKIICFLITLFMIISGFTFVGCDFTNQNNNDNGFPKIENSVDLVEYTPTQNENNDFVDDQTYYTSKSLDLVTEIHGNYTTNRPFILDSENPNKRIYKNIYFYLDDFFQVLYYKDINSLGSLYAILNDETDKDFATIEYSTGGSPLQINIIQQGIYDLVLDIQNFGIDMIKVGDIDTPIYETVKHCELKIQVGSNSTYSQMTLNNETNEYFIEKEIPFNASISFHNASHTGKYKLDILQEMSDTLVYLNNTDTTKLNVHIGGNYKIYFNAKTYVVRLELQNPDSANYYCQVGFNQNQELTPNSTNPYLFEYEFVAQGKVNDPYVEIPNFYPKLGMSYKLRVIDLDGYVFIDTYVKESGTYKLTINLKDFTLSVSKLS